MLLWEQAIKCRRDHKGKETLIEGIIICLSSHHLKYHKAPLHSEACHSDLYPRAAVWTTLQISAQIQSADDWNQLIFF